MNYLNSAEDEGIVVDVREKDEFIAESVAGAIHLPLSEFGHQGPAILAALRARRVVLLCRSGGRAEMAKAAAERFGIPDLRLDIYEGGLRRWKEQGGVTIRTGTPPLPLMRQVQLIAGLLVLVSAILTLLQGTRYVVLAGFVGAGLTLAGATGFCGLAKVLAWMPWNRKQGGAQARGEANCGCA